jgi:arylsulfatase A-like enzyme
MLPLLVLAIVAAACSSNQTDGAGEDEGSIEPAQQLNGGRRLDNTILTTPLCCPSRATYLTGRYSHSHGIHGNNYLPTDGNGGLRRFFEQGYEDDTIADWLQAAGYHTAIVGKYLNGFPNDPGNFVDETYLPPGWDEAYIPFIRAADFSYYDFRMGENGEVVDYGAEEPAYLTDVEREHAVDVIGRAASGGEPFFLYLAPYAPHGPIQPAHRHRELHRDVEIVDPPSIDEDDLSDKPQHVQNAAGADEAAYTEDATLRLRLDMTLAVDELLRAVFDELERQEVLSHTYVFLASDNGLLLGEHAVGGKSFPYEPSITVPLLVRGPGIEAGSIEERVAANIDLAPTLLELAGVEIPPSVDGESLVPLLDGTDSAWRDAVLVEMLARIESPNLDEFNIVVPPYRGVRTDRYAYVQWATGEEELYDLVEDPYQLDSIHSSRPEVIAELSPFVAALEWCAGAGCAAAARQAEPDLPGIEHDCRDQTCSFTAHPPADRPTPPTEYHWELGDGATGSGPTVEHTFPDAASYLVTLTARFPDGPLAAQKVVGAGASTDPIVVTRILAPREGREIRFRVEVGQLDGQVVEGADVGAAWSVDGVPTGAATALTSSTGRAGFTVTAPSGAAKVELCVVTVRHPRFRYEPGDQGADCKDVVLRDGG